MQVQDPNFGEHTLEGIDDLKGRKNANIDDHYYNEKQDKQNNQEIFSKVEGLDLIQVRGVMLGLTKEQIENDSSCTEDVLKVMDLIHTAFPEMELSILYRTAMNLDKADRITFFLDNELDREEIRSLILDEDPLQQDLNSTEQNVSEEKNSVASGEKDLKMLAETGGLKRGSSASSEEKSISSKLNKKRRGNRI